MFQNLKQHINRENLHAIKKKNRYLEDQNLSDQQEDHLDHLKHKKSANSPLDKTSKSAKPFLLKEKKSPSESQDSLSDYELQQREEVFAKLTSQPQIQFSPVQKQKITFTNAYFTPESRIKELQRSVELSSQKLKLAEEYHSRELSALSEKHDRTVRELILQMEKLKLVIEKQNQRDGRIDEVLKQNSRMRETLEMYEEKYWKFEEIEKINIKLQTENKVLKLQNVKLKDLISQIQSIHQSNQSPSLSSHFPQHSQLQNLQHKLTQTTKTISGLQKKLSDVQHQQQLDQMFYQQKTKSMQRKIQELEESLRHKQKQLAECQVRCERLKTEKEMMEKSLLQTMQSFSKHLSNQSLNQQHNLALMTQINRSVAYSGKRAQQRMSPPNDRKVTSYNEPTINLDEEDENAFDDAENNQKNKELSEVSPVPVKKVTFYEPQIAQFQLPQNKQRTRVMSSYISGTSVKPTKRRNEYDPEKSEQKKIIKLERKLEEANQKIVDLLRQKLSRATQPQKSLLLR